MAPSELNVKFGIDLSRPTLLATFHPATLESEPVEYQFHEFSAALDEAGLPVVFTAPNADPGHHSVERGVEEYLTGHPDARLVKNLGTRGYFSLMQHAAAMVGNSSSGIIEAASFALPVVNVGSRQEGRIRPTNVLDCACRRVDVLKAIRRAVTPEFRAKLAVMENPYWRGGAAAIIADTLIRLELTPDLTMKTFHDLPEPFVGGDSR
jgi:UDP-hydrolysing UDP-N-acetyl-D-glucosamine 2-epimerase